MNIIWKGNQHTNSSSREGYVPLVIVDHISAGTMNSMDAWFTDPNNKVSSAHFGVSKDGRIHQYVAIERMAWAQGIPQSRIPEARAQVVKDMKVNPNLYSVSIEHEGMRGNLTEEQFSASVWLHRYIQDYIYDQYGTHVPLDRYYVIGHSDVNPRGKPYCPGPQFPWERLYSTLSKEEEQAMEQLKNQLAALSQQHEELKARVEQLEQRLSMEHIPDWAKEAVKKAADEGLVLNPENSSYDFYRILTVLNRKGII